MHRTALIRRPRRPTLKSSNQKVAKKYHRNSRLREADSDSERVPTPNATPFELDSCAADDVVADVAHKLEKLEKENADQTHDTHVTGGYFDFAHEDANASEALADDEYFKNVSQKSTAADASAFAADTTANADGSRNEAQTIALQPANSFGDDCFRA